MSNGFDQFVSEKVFELRDKLNWIIVKTEGYYYSKWRSSHVSLYSDKWTKTGRHFGIWLGNGCEHFNLQRLKYSKTF